MDHNRSACCKLGTQTQENMPTAFCTPCGCNLQLPVSGHTMQMKLCKALFWPMVSVSHCGGSCRPKHQGSQPPQRNSGYCTCSQSCRQHGYYAKHARHKTRRADTKAYEQQNEPGTACWDECSALLRNRLCVPLFPAGVFDSEELHMLHRGHRNGLSSCRLGCRLGCSLGCRPGCHLGSTFGCTLG